MVFADHACLDLGLGDRERAGLIIFGVYKNQEPPVIRVLSDTFWGMTVRSLNICSYLLYADWERSARNDSSGIHPLSMKRFCLHFLVCPR